MKDRMEPHVKALERETLLVSVIVSVLSAVICMQIIARIGITPNTSIIGALLAMAIARLPSRRWRSSGVWTGRTSSRR